MGTCIRTGEDGRGRDTGTETTDGGREEIMDAGGTGTIGTAVMIETEDMTAIEEIIDPATGGNKALIVRVAELYFLRI